MGLIVTHFMFLYFILNIQSLYSMYLVTVEPDIVHGPRFSKYNLSLISLFHVIFPPMALQPNFGPWLPL
jgi:hypothetical protein